MRYKVISSVIALLLIATPVLAQKSVPILTQTLRTTNPTAVITGQPLRQAYVVRFIDLTHLGEEIMIRKEDLDHKSMGDFEVTDFGIVYETKQGQFLEHYWYVNYTLRVINSQKGPKVIPSFVVPWKLKKAGQQENEPGILFNYDLKTEEVHLNYVSTIPAKDPNLIIRDQMDFGTFSTSALVLRSASWFLAVAPLGLWLLLFSLRLRSAGRHFREEEIVKPEEDFLDGVKDGKLSLWRIKRQLQGIIRRVKKIGLDRYPENTYDLMPELYNALMAYLRLKVRNSTVGTTGTEMLGLVGKLADGSNKRALAQLAERAAAYQYCLEGGRLSVYWLGNPLRDAKLLKKTLRNLSWYMVIVNYFADRIYWGW